MSKLYKAIFVVALCIAMVTSALGADIKSSPWAIEAVKSAAENGFVPTSLLSKANEAITRKEMCSLIMQFYRVYTGTDYKSKAKSQFIDEQSTDVVTAVELGLFSGMSDSEFEPNEKVTREQMAAVMARLFNKVNIKLTPNSPSDEVFKDNSKISDWAKPSVALLKKNSIINGDSNGYFNPKAITTTEQVIAVLMQTQDTFSQSTTGAQAVRVDNVTINLGENLITVLSKLGEPTRIDKNEFGTQRYVFANNYKNFVMVGIRDSKVVEIYTNAAGLGYGTITSKTTYGTMKFDKYKTYSSEKAVYQTDKYIFTVFFDSLDSQRVDAVYLRSSDLTQVNNFYGVDYEAYVEGELFDIINSSRVKNGLEAYSRSSYSDVVAKAHSTEMQSVLRSDYNSIKGLTPFQRMDKAGIKYSLAAENIFTENSGDAIEIYGWWMSNVSTRSNLLSDNFTHIGIGCVGSSYKKIFFTTADMFAAE
ncbi:MAG: S-layer homology domain-containing protein [Lachnospiraceae bacterium]|nr:S-layer homology domain-containing protein [Lachnospiraceae bacterium]